MTWIPCAERMPLESVTVLGWRHGFEMILCLWLSKPGVQWWSVRSNTMTTMYAPTHWMEIPPPPPNDGKSTR